MNTTTRCAPKQAPSGRSYYVTHATHNLLWAASLLLLACAISGCAPKTPSLVTPGTTVDLPALVNEENDIRASLEARAAALNADTKSFVAKDAAARAELNAQAARNTAIVQAVGGLASLASSGTFTWPAAIGSAINLLGIAIAGVAVKNKLTNPASAEAEPPPPTLTPPPLA